MKIVVAGALGECVHVAGVSRFLQLAKKAGWETRFLGPAVPVEKFVAAIEEARANADEVLAGVSYRLTPETGERLLGEFAEQAADLHEAGVRFAFGGTPPMARRAEKLGFFEKVFDGSEPSEEVLAYLRGNSRPEGESSYPQTLIERIQWKSPYPVLRHHFGRPTMQETLEGIRKIAEERAMDVISLGIDQDAQENFFHPERQNPRRRGAGGVPVRSAEDYRALYEATRRGNFPLLRTYSGTNDFIRLAEMYVETIHIAWAAVPLFWFNRMDGRGPLGLETSLHEHQALMAWYAARGIPVEVNEPHHWGMRDAPDVIFVVAAYLSAYNAKAAGVRDYIAQLMFNSPAGLSDAMDLAKMLAILEMISPLESETFRIWRQTRTGLLSYPVQSEAARAHLAASIYLQMALKPHIVHIVGYTEADHAVTADEVIESSKMARRAIENALGQPDFSRDPRVQERKEELLREAAHTLDAIRALGAPDGADPLTHPATLARAVTEGILDAPQLINNPYGRGLIRSGIDERGACVALDESGNLLRETDRLTLLKKSS